MSKLAGFRRHLHEYPEVSGKEAKTAAFIKEVLAGLGPDRLLTEVGGTGLLAYFDSARPGPALLFRAELDALPIQEENDFSYRSATPGVSHKCGHDGHMSILLGLAHWLHGQRPAKGKVLLLFQPSEENGAGAKAVLEDPRLSDLQLDFVFALHNLPGYPKHEILLKAGPFTAAVHSIIIKLYGKTSHAAEPENGINPALAIAEILTGANELAVPDTERIDFALLTPVHIQMGEKAYGVSAGYGEIHLTLRTWKQARMQQLMGRLQALIRRVAAGHRLRVETEWTDPFHANRNDETAVELIRESALSQELSVRELAMPIKWGEDFGLFTQRFPGALFGLGAGERTPALHNPDYDYPDDLTPTGVQIFSGIVRQLLF